MREDVNEFKEERKVVVKPEEEEEMGPRGSVLINVKVPGKV